MPGAGRERARAAGAERGDERERRGGAALRLRMPLDLDRAVDAARRGPRARCPARSRARGRRPRAPAAARIRPSAPESRSGARARRAAWPRPTRRPRRRWSRPATRAPRERRRSRSGRILSARRRHERRSGTAPRPASAIARFAPRARQACDARATAAACPAMTVCSGELKLAGERRPRLAPPRGRRLRRPPGARPTIAAIAPTPARHGLLHELPAARARGARRRRRRERPAATLAEYSPSECPAAKAAPSSRSGNRAREVLERGDRVGQDRRLRVGGELQLLLGPLEAEPREREAEDRVGLVEDRARRRRRLAERLAHADGLGALAGKEQGERHGAA